MKGFIVKILPVLALMVAFSSQAHAQFKEEAFTQSYVTDTTATQDTVYKMWSFKQFFRGVAHKDTIKIGTMFAGSTVFIGTGQMYNRQYWKLPVIYGGLGATIGMGIHYRNKYNDSKKAYDTAFALDPETSLTVDTHSKDLSTYLFASAGLIYWATLMDEIVNYNRDVPHQPGKATLYSVVMPGLGQAYNGEYWKIPIYWGFLVGSYHYYRTNQINYKRFKRIHNEATDSDSGYSESISASTALYYRNLYRRYRDYSMVAMIGSYVLQIIDANVFAYMRDFEVNDDLTMKISPTVITPDNAYASSFRLSSPSSYTNSAIGLQGGFTF